MFVRRFIGRLNVLKTRIGTMNLHFHGPRLCRRPAAATFELRRFIESPFGQAVMHCDHEPI